MDFHVNTREVPRGFGELGRRAIFREPGSTAYYFRGAEASGFGFKQLPRATPVNA